jgi:O-antigen/teichoic acid export membrane protein
VAVATALVIGVKTASQSWPSPRNWRLLRRREWKSNGGFAFLALTASGPTELDKALAARFMPLELAGIYSAASRVAGAVMVPVSSMMTAALPRLFRESSQGLPQPRLLRWIFGCSLAYGLGAAAALWLVAPLADQLFGQAFRGLSNALRWLSLLVPGLCLRLAGVNLLMSIGRPWVRVGIEGTGTVLMLSCAMILAPVSGISGMAGAVIIAESTMAVLTWAWITVRYLNTGRLLRAGVPADTRS